MLVHDDVGRERLEAGDRILERPRRVAGIDVDADVVGPGRFDQAGQLPRLHVAGVVLDRDLDPGRLRLVAHRLADLDGVPDVRLDAAVRAAILVAAEERSESPATRRSSRSGCRPCSCSTAVPAFASKAPDVGQMLNMPTYTAGRAFVGLRPQLSRYASSRRLEDVQLGEEHARRASSGRVIDERGAFQPRPRSEKWSKPSLMPRLGAGACGMWPIVPRLHRCGGGGAAAPNESRSRTPPARRRRQGRYVWCVSRRES